MELRYVPQAEFDRIRSLEGDRYERTAAFADACRLNVLYMVQRVGSGHLGTTFSSLDIVCWLHLEVLGRGRPLLLLQGPRRSRPVRRPDRARPAGLRPDPPAAAAGRPARPPRRRRHAGGGHEHGLARDGDLEGARLRPRRPAARPHGRRLRPHRRRRAPGGADLGVAAADRQPRPGGDHRHRRPQRGPVGHLGSPGERPRRPGGEGRGLRLGARALRRARRALARGDARGAAGREGSGSW